MEPLLLRADEVQKALGLGRSKVYEMLASGELPAVRIGRAVRVPAAALPEWVKARASEEAESQNAITVPVAASNTEAKGS